MSTSRPTVAELRAVAQPASVVGRVSGEHWAGKLYMRRVSIYFTRLLVTTPLSADGLTGLMILVGLGAAALVTVRSVWAVLGVVLLIQLQELIDCSDGELARWRGTTGARGIYLDRIGHYVTDAGLAIGVGLHAGYPIVGLTTGVLVMLTKAETDLVHVARAGSGLAPVVDDVATARPHQSLVRRLRRVAATVPFNRALLAIEMTGLALAAAIADDFLNALTAMRVLSVALLVIAVIVAVGHLLSVLTSGRLR